MSKYKELHSSVQYDEVELQAVANDIQSSISTSTDTDSNDHYFTPQEIHTAIGKLKSHKKEWSGDLTTDNFINARDDSCFL